MENLSLPPIHLSRTMFVAISALLLGNPRTRLSLSSPPPLFQHKKPGAYRLSSQSLHPLPSSSAPPVHQVGPSVMPGFLSSTFI